MPENGISKKKNLKRLQDVLDVPNEDLHPEDEKHLRSLSKRLKRSSENNKIIREIVQKQEENKQELSLKPKVVIYSRSEKAGYISPKKVVEDKKIKLGVEEDSFEIEKVEVKEPEFVEVKPTGLIKSSEPELVEWKPVEVEKIKKDELIETTTKKDLFCPECGYKLIEGASSCSKCGYEINSFSLEEKKQETSKDSQVKNDGYVEWEPVDDLKKNEEKAIVEFEEIETKKEIPQTEIKTEEIDQEKLNKIEVFKDFKSVDENTAILLYDNGFTSVESLNNTTVKDLKKIKGIKRKKAKEIKREIDEKIQQAAEVKPIEVGDTAEGELTVEQIKEEIVEVKEPEPAPVELSSQTSEWAPVEEKKEPEEIIPSETVEKKDDLELLPPPEVELIKREEKIQIFSDFKSIDEDTAVLLYDNGIINIDSLKKASYRDIKKIKGIKRKKAKEIKKELQAKEEWKTLELEEIPTEVAEVETAEEIKPEEEIEEKNIIEEEPIVTVEQLENKEEELKKRQEKIDIFKEIKSIDENTAILLYDNGFLTIESLNTVSVKDLKKIKGIKRKKAKEIRRELDEKIQQAAEVKPIEVGETAEGELKKEQIKEEIIEEEELVPAPVELSSKTSEWNPVQEQTEEPEEILNVEEIIAQRKQKTDAFKDLKIINEETAILLYNNGITSLDAFKSADINDILKIDGIKKRLIKKAKKKLDKQMNLEKNDVIEKEEETLEKEFFSEFSETQDNLVEKEEMDQKIESHIPLKIEEENEEFFNEEDLEEVPIKEDYKKVIVFKNIKSIDENISRALIDNGIDSIDKLNSMTVKELRKTLDINRWTARKIKKEVSKLSTVTAHEDKFSQEAYLRGANPYVEEKDEWESYDEKKERELDLSEKKGYKHKNFILYEKKVKTKSGKKRTIRFFSKGEPEKSKPINLPKNYAVKVNKKTGLPYLIKKKKAKKT